ncbi:hypothetical protein DFP72DRAFT_1179113 [Ephemerocybe angulata]|uniref:Uncharacterized protein n=1 Tax=Ephemerocybe angulata TaxID=980116 RepID=A0A8H6LVG1_9AGAR|nr:hypothetical protein DFP72DRAFT_1179113 [Tulosesus angulatus]
MPCYDMENVADFAITANIADSTIYMPTLTPVQQKPLDTSGDAVGQSSCAHPAQLNGVTYHRYVNMRGPIVAGEINHSIIGGTEHASVPPTSRSATGSGNDRSEHFHIKNCDSWVSAGRIERSVVVHRNADHDQAKSEERAFRDASDGPSSSLDPPGCDNQKLDPKQSGGSTRGAPQGPAISTRRGRGHADNAESLSLASRLKRAERHALAALKRHKLETSVKPTGKTPKARPFAFTATTEYTPFDDSDDPMLNWQYTSSSKTKL